MNEENYVQAVKNMRCHTKPLENEGAYWNDPERNQLRRLFNDGVGITEIAIVMGRSEPAIMQQAEKMDLYDRKDNPRRKKAFSLESIRMRCACACKDCTADEFQCPHHIPFSNR